MLWPLKVIRPLTSLLKLAHTLKQNIRVYHITGHVIVSKSIIMTRASMYRQQVSSLADANGGAWCRLVMS